MSPFTSLHCSGAPSFTAASASLNIPGLEDLHPSHIDTTIFSSDWYHESGQHIYLDAHPEELTGQHQNSNLGYPSHSVPVSGEAAGGPQNLFNNSMDGHQFPYLQPNNGISQLDSVQNASPLQPMYSSSVYQTPYSDSAVSSGPSDDPLIAEADEDKRKRNQAASARFRQKKKQREQHMKEESREMQEKTRRLEGEVEGLKRENTFLKKLLVEKVDNMSEEDKAMLAKTASDTSQGN